MPATSAKITAETSRIESSTAREQFDQDWNQDKKFLNSSKSIQITSYSTRLQNQSRKNSSTNFSSDNKENSETSANIKKSNARYNYLDPLDQSNSIDTNSPHCESKTLSIRIKRDILSSADSTPDLIKQLHIIIDDNAQTNCQYSIDSVSLKYSNLTMHLTCQDASDINIIQDTLSSVLSDHHTSSKTIHLSKLLKTLVFGDHKKITETIGLENSVTISVFKSNQRSPKSASNYFSTKLDQITSIALSLEHLNETWTVNFKGAAENTENFNHWLIDKIKYSQESLSHFTICIKNCTEIGHFQAIRDYIFEKSSCLVVQFASDTQDSCINLDSTITIQSDSVFEADSGNSKLENAYITILGASENVPIAVSYIIGIFMTFKNKSITLPPYLFNSVSNSLKKNIDTNKYMFLSISFKPPASKIFIQGLESDLAEVETYINKCYAKYKENIFERRFTLKNENINNKTRSKIKMIEKDLNCQIFFQDNIFYLTSKSESNVDAALATLEPLLRFGHNSFETLLIGRNNLFKTCSELNNLSLKKYLFLNNDTATSQFKDIPQYYKDEEDHFCLQVSDNLENIMEIRKRFEMLHKSQSSPDCKDQYTSEIIELGLPSDSHFVHFNNMLFALRKFIDSPNVFLATSGDKLLAIYGPKQCTCEAKEKVEQFYDSLTQLDHFDIEIQSNFSELLDYLISTCHVENMYYSVMKSPEFEGTEKIRIYHQSIDLELIQKSVLSKIAQFSTLTKTRMNFKNPSLTKFLAKKQIKEYLLNLPGVHYIFPQKSSSIKNMDQSTQPNNTTLCIFTDGDSQESLDEIRNFLVDCHECVVKFNKHLTLYLKLILNSSNNPTLVPSSANPTPATSKITLKHISTEIDQKFTHFTKSEPMHRLFVAITFNRMNLCGTKESVQRFADECQKICDSYQSKECTYPYQVCLSILGRRGSKKSELQKKFGVALSFPNLVPDSHTNKDSRGLKSSMLIYGVQRNIDKICEYIDENYQYSEMLIENSVVGKIIGKKGANIIKFSEKYGVSANLINHSNESILHVIGSRSSIEKTLAELNQNISQFSKQEFIIPDNLTDLINYRQPKWDSIRQKYKLISLHLNNNCVTISGNSLQVEGAMEILKQWSDYLTNSHSIQISIPKKCFGHIVGKKLQRLNTMKHKFDVDIYILPNRTNSAKDLPTTTNSSKEDITSNYLAQSDESPTETLIVFAKSPDILTQVESLIKSQITKFTTYEQEETTSPNKSATTDAFQNKNSTVSLLSTDND